MHTIIKRLSSMVAIVAICGMLQGSYASSPGNPSDAQVLKVCSQEAQICLVHLMDLYDHGLVSIEQIDPDWIRVTVLEDGGGAIILIMDNF